MKNILMVCCLVIAGCLPNEVPRRMWMTEKVERQKGIATIMVPIKEKENVFSSGTCFYMDTHGKRVVVTAGHVVEDDEGNAIISKRADIAIYHNKKSKYNAAFTPQTTEPWPPYVWVIGYNMGTYTEIKTKIIGYTHFNENKDGPIIEHFKLAHEIKVGEEPHGMSGSPVLTPDRKRVIGVLISGMGKKPVMTCVKIEEAVKLVDRNWVIGITEAKR